jgi:hypothetical protein
MQDPELTTLSPSYADDVAVILRPAGTRTSVCRVQSRSRKSEQDDKWNFCLITAIVAVKQEKP